MPPQDTESSISRDIERELQLLGRSLPGMHARHPVEADFWASFKSCAGEIGLRARNEGELRRVQMRLVLMLSETPGGVVGPA
ncbi:hypothetical protein QFW77_18950 [Luteimonas sp. RD2P54]|uniref:Uncharacterized protein n=1 Tax=Luteimonas endophytica TaxID=3042023 RepID=A0ABT6JE95_9GAMM|nr:hypothetical protein [Luteimonas endophytica]MDH5825049.1 hypothetical protein [Luteimonas endophytica]